MIDSINALHTKYKDRPAILCKMEEYMNKQLPHALDLFVEPFHEYLYRLS